MPVPVNIARIEKHYGDTQTLRSVSLDIRPGEFMTLVGPSGCGKSTLLRIVAGLAPQTGGTVEIDGKPVDHLGARARGVAMVFQSYALYPHMTVAQNIANPLRVSELPALARLPLIGRLVPGMGRKRQAIAERARKTAQQVEIDHLLDRKPAALSGGQRQRVALARAMIRDPQVFLMDEPLSNLDARLRVTMRGEIRELHKRLGATFIYVTHDQVEAMTMSDRVAVMMNGEIVQCASPQELYENPADLRVAQFIGTPAINVAPVGVLREWAAAQVETGIDKRQAPDLPHGTEQIAFRPEAVRLDAETAGLRLRCRLLRHELLGHDVLLFLRSAIGGIRLTTRMSAADFCALPRNDSEINVTLPDGELLAFDGDGRRLRAEKALDMAAARVTAANRQPAPRMTPEIANVE